MAVKQTAGRTALGEFAPKFAELNDDVLFGQVWSREDIFFVIMSHIYRNKKCTYRNNVFYKSHYSSKHWA